MMVDEEKLKIIQVLVNMSDRKVISEKTGLSIEMINSVLIGRRFNQSIIDHAYEVAKQKAYLLFDFGNSPSK